MTNEERTPKKENCFEICDFNNNINKNKEEASFYYNLGQDYYNLGQDHFFKTTKDNAVENLRRVIDNYKKAIENFKRAIENYKKVIENYEEVSTYRNLGLSYYHLGITYKELGQTYEDLGITCEDLGITCEDNYEKAIDNYINMGQAYVDMRKITTTCKDDLTDLLNKFEQTDNDLKHIYREIGILYEDKKEDLNKAYEYYSKSGKEDILEMLICFQKENRKKVIEQNLLKEDEYFTETIKNQELSAKDKNKYKGLYFNSIYIISLLHMDEEEKVAYYTKKDVAEKMLFKEKDKDKVYKFRLNSINYSNDPSEGKVLLDYLFGKERSVINDIDNPYRAFASCFTSNCNSLNQFRLYGKDKDKECTGVSIVFKPNFFDKLPRLGTYKQEEQEDIQKKPEEKHALFRCIYIDPITNKVFSVGWKDDFLFYQEWRNDVIPKGKDIKLCDKEANNEYKEYNNKIETLIREVSLELDELKKQIVMLDKNIVSQLLINLCYLTKHIAFKEEQEYRIVKIKNIRDKEEVKVSENKKQMYLEYLEIGQHVNEIYFAPNASGMNIFQDRLLREGLQIKCIKSENPFAEDTVQNNV